MVNRLFTSARVRADPAVLLVEQNGRAGLGLARHGIVTEAGRVGLRGSGREVLEHPEIAGVGLGRAG